MTSPDAPSPPPPRDPLLDDPAFAELVEPPKPAVPPASAEPAEVPVESLPVAEVVRPKATPVAGPKIAPRTTMPVPVETEPPRPQWVVACGVIGCTGVLVIAALAALIYIAITLLSNMGDKIGETKPTAPDKVVRGPLGPTVLGNDIELDLPGRVDAVCRGGGGRFLLMRIPNPREIHVFDANQAQIVHRIVVEEKGTLIAAGSDKFYTCDPLEAKLTRYSLFSGAKEADAKLPKDARRPMALAMGADASGPLRLIGVSNAKLSIHNFDSNLVLQSTDLLNASADAETGVLARASDNGMVLGVSHRGGAEAVWYGTGRLTSKSLSSGNDVKPSWAYPSPDGQYFYTPRGVFDTGANPSAGTRSGFYTFPTASGSDRFLSFEETDETVGGSVRVHTAGERSLAKHTSLEKAFLAPPGTANTLTKDELTAADRVHYWPAAGLVAVLPHAAAQKTPKLLLFKVPVVVK